MMMSSQVNDQGIDNNIIQPSDVNYATPSINSSWSSTGQLISFGSSEHEKNRPKYKEISKKVCSKNEHVVAERKRRERMTQGFLALSDLIPGLKKVPFLIYVACYLLHPISL